MATHTAHATQTVNRARRPAVSSGAPVLASKIAPPGMPDWAVQRLRITKLIARGTRWRPLTVLTGLAGTGKTTALALWAAAEPRAVAWVSLDEFDNWPGVFWSNVTEALRRSGVAVASRSAGRERDGDDWFLLRLAAALADRDPPVNLVLDDVHLLTEPRVLKGLDFVLRNAGSGLRLLVASRTDPLLPLHRYRLAEHLTEIRASDLAFTTAEAGQLLARHGYALRPDALENLTQQTEGWAAGLRLAALSMHAHPDPAQAIRELIAQDSFLTSYLVDEVLNTQPPQIRDMLLSTSILEHFNADTAVELAGEQAAGIVTALAHTGAFVRPTGPGWYRYHTLLAEVLRLELRREHPDRVAALHRQAARWYGRNGLLADAVRHAAQADDWPLAASLVIDQLATGQIINPDGRALLAGEFADMPPGHAWTEPQPHVVAAAIALSAGRPESSVAALDAADAILERVPADQQPESRLTAALIRLAACLRTGDLAAAAPAAARAELLAGQIPAGKLARHPDIQTQVLCGRGAIELWSGHLDEAARILQAAVAAPAASGRDEPADCLGLLALAEAFRGRLNRAAELAGRAALTTGEHRPPAWTKNPAPLVALAWVHLHRNELRETHSWLKRADAALTRSPDKLIGAAACLVAAGGALAEGRATAAAQIITRARSGWPVPAWLDQQLSLLQSRASAAAGDIPATLTAAARAGSGTSPEAAVTLAHAWAAAGDADSAQRALAPVLAAGSGTPDRVRLQAWLVDARLSYTSGDPERGRRSLASALRLAEREQLRLPFAVERSWLGPVLRRDAELIRSHQGLLAPSPHPDQPPAPAPATEQAPVLVVEPLTRREREVLMHVSAMRNTAEIASEMYISVNTVKSHLKSILRKLAATHRREAVRRARELRLI